VLIQEKASSPHSITIAFLFANWYIALWTANPGNARAAQEILRTPRARIGRSGSGTAHRYHGSFL